MTEELVQELASTGDLPDEDLRTLLGCRDAALVECLHSEAREKAVKVFGRKVYLRGLIEWSNVCRNDCLYCGIRRSNSGITRYTLSKEEIVSCCGNAYEAGLRTFVLQGGENPAAAASLAPVIREIKASWPDCAVTLSLGELPFETYALLRRSGADRYLLRHETADTVHYSRLHPSGMAIETRLECIRQLKSLGFQTGMGMMVGSPFQTLENLVMDIRLIQSVRPEMIGIGPFIPHKDTPFAAFPAGSADLTLRLYSILRLMLPGALIPSTTALSTLEPGGRIKGILAGANVIMPVFTPPSRRDDYSLYDGKAFVDTAAQIENIKNDLSSIGYEAVSERGDYREI